MSADGVPISNPDFIGFLIVSWEKALWHNRRNGDAQGRNQTYTNRAMPKKETENENTIC